MSIASQSAMPLELPLALPRDPARVSRRQILHAGAMTGLGMLLPGAAMPADKGPAMITKAIPSTGQRIPVLGLGTANQYGRAEYQDVRDIVKRMHEFGGTVIDTAALYRGSEEAVGNSLAELGLLKDM